MFYDQWSFDNVTRARPILSTKTLKLHTNRKLAILNAFIYLFLIHSIKQLIYSA